MNHPNVALVVTLGNAITLRRIMESIKESCSQSEINFDCSSSGIDIQALGPNHVSLISVSLLSSGFECFVCKENISLGINISGLTSFLKQVTKSDQITILHGGGSRECCFILEDGQRSSTFEMKLKQIESNLLIITDVGYSSEWMMPSVSFQRICRDLKSCMTGEYVHICVTRDQQMTFKCSGVYGQLQIHCENEVTTCLKWNSNPCEMCYSYPYLNSFTKATPLSQDVVIKLGENCPLMCGYEIVGLGHVNFYLAPKVNVLDQ
eukprot:TRINITY_DN3175_c0_g1_i7.p1 TRINITY_DN3175_c0_g1~~TRINITY_DN3175_c0_g1_i7.p1  ORF type:complete len:264 (+),score=41.58 TRINITY_DN3175_c0_g1_i7:751-1542(+)